MSIKDILLKTTQGDVIQSIATANTMLQPTMRTATKDQHILWSASWDPPAIVSQLTESTLMATIEMRVSRKGPQSSLQLSGPLWFLLRSGNSQGKHSSVSLRKQKESLPDWAQPLASHGVCFIVLA